MPVYEGFPGRKDPVLIKLVNRVLDAVDFAARIAVGGITTAKIANEAVTTEKIETSARPVFTKRELSAGFAVSGAGNHTFEHGLGERPKAIRVYAKCITAQHNFSIGDEVELNTNLNEGGSTSAGRGVQLVFDDTNVDLRFGSSASPLRIFNKTTGAQADLTNANWEVYIEVFA
jgi:hypothetical protein